MVKVEEVQWPNYPLSLYARATAAIIDSIHEAERGGEPYLPLSMSFRIAQTFSFDGQPLHTGKNDVPEEYRRLTEQSRLLNVLCRFMIRYKMIRYGEVRLDLGLGLPQLTTVIYTTWFGRSYLRLPSFAWTIVLWIVLKIELVRKMSPFVRGAMSAFTVGGAMWGFANNQTVLGYWAMLSSFVVLATAILLILIFRIR